MARLRPVPLRHAACAVLLAAAGLTLAAPAALAQEGWDNAPSAKNMPLGSQKGPTDPYTAAMSFKQKGEFDKAVPLLTAIAAQGVGYEIAQLELGRCYLQMADHAPSPKVAWADRTRGLGWVLKAAEAGFGGAQEEIVRLYLDGTAVPQDVVEAAKWYLLWRRNPSRMQIGASHFDTGLETRLKEAMRPVDWRDAEQRAVSWRPS